jgi:ribosomal protein L12E/L44/L45/RPP1/RPP2
MLQADKLMTVTSTASVSIPPFLAQALSTALDGKTLIEMVNHLVTLHNSVQEGEKDGDSQKVVDTDLEEEKEDSDEEDMCFCLGFDLDH